MTGLRILVVEDEPLVAMLHEDLIVQAGHVPLDLPMCLDSAVSSAANDTFDIAIVDSELWGHPADAVVAELTKRGKPFMVCSGHSRDDLPENLRERTNLRKPYDLVDLRQALDALVRKAA